MSRWPVAKSTVVHFLPFFFLLFPPPPPDAPCVAAGAAVTVFSSNFGAATGPLSTSILSPSGTAAVGAAVVVVGISITSPFANLPSAVNSLPTSAALSVRYFKHIPDSGWYVFKVSTAERSRLEVCGPAAVESFVGGAAVSLGFDFDFVLGLRGREYLVVIRDDGYAWMRSEDWCR